MNEKLKQYLISGETVSKHSKEEWNKVQQDHGVVFPGDYIEFIDNYGTGSIDDFLWIYSPWCQNENLNFFTSGKMAGTAYRVSHEESPEDFPFAVYPEEGGLLPLGGTDNGDDLYWLTVGANPEKWKLIIYMDRSEDYLEYDLTMTDFLAGLFSGEVKCEVMPEWWGVEKKISFFVYDEKGKDYMNDDLPKVLGTNETGIRHRRDEWQSIQKEHDVVFPADYMEYIDFYGIGTIEDYMWIFSPWSKNDQLNLFANAKRALAEYSKLHREYPTEHPFPLYPEKNGLLPFGATKNGDILYWQNTNDSADLWNLIIYNASAGTYQTYNLIMTDFLVGVIKGRVSCEIVPKVWSKKPMVNFISDKENWEEREKIIDE